MVRQGFCPRCGEWMHVEESEPAVLAHEVCPYNPVNARDAPVWRLPYRELAPSGERIYRGLVMPDGAVPGLVCVVNEHTVGPDGVRSMLVRAASTGPLPEPDPRTYDDPGTKTLTGLPPVCAAALRELGFHHQDRRYLAAFEFRDLSDVETFRRRTREEWARVGWWGEGRPGSSFTFEDVETLIAAGVSHGRAQVLREAGFSTVAAILAAEPPPVPDAATRIVIRRPSYRVGDNQVTDDPGAARAWLAYDLTRWRSDLVTAETGPRLLHGTETWTIWDDDVLLADARWINPLNLPPSTLSPAARYAISLCATALSPLVDPAVWKPLLAAVAHHRVDTGLVRRHGFTLPDGRELSLWESGKAVFTDEAAALAPHRRVDADLVAWRESGEDERDYW